MTWTDLTAQQQERLSGLALTLQEFIYGLESAGLMSLVTEEGSTAQRFYSNSLYQYFSNVFLVSGSQRNRDLLTEIGCADLLETIDRILAYKVGAQTLDYVIRAFRDKQLVHTSFRSDQLRHHLRSDVDFDDPCVAVSIPIWIFDLFSRTRDLYDNLVGRFPELYEGDS